MEQLFAELGLDMQAHLEWLAQIRLEDISPSTIEELAERIPLAGDGSWEF